MRQTDADGKLRLLTLCLLIRVIASKDPYLVSCPPGTFGYWCEFNCKCVNQPQCSGFGGQCVICQPGFFGPGCQYLNVMAELGLPDTPSYLMDGNTSTCNPNQKEISLTISLNRSVSFTWFRIHTKEDFSNRDMSVMLDDENCHVRRMYRVSENILDVSCEKTTPRKQFRIEGPIVGHICELGISWGRNVALRQNVNQSGAVASSASNAVDGSTSLWYDEKTCARTSGKLEALLWTMVYRVPNKLIRILVYNSNPKPIRLSGFQLELFEKESDAVPVFVFKSDPKEVTMVYDIDVPVLTPPVMVVKILKPMGANDTENILTLCEVETFGDHVCEDGFFHPTCSRKCNCKDNLHCNQITGVCGTACNIVGFHTNCSYPCQPNCLNNQCLNAKCVSCKPKFAGPYCDEECAEGMYGPHCDRTCSKNCKGGNCNLTNGHCSACIGKQAMPFCEDPSGNDTKNELVLDSGFNWIYILPVLLLLPLAMVFFCCFWRKKSVKPATVPESQPVPAKVEPEEQTLTSEEKALLSQFGSNVDIAVKENPSGAEQAEKA